MKKMNLMVFGENNFYYFSWHIMLPLCLYFKLTEDKFYTAAKRVCIYAIRFFHALYVYEKVYLGVL